MRRTTRVRERACSFLIVPSPPRLAKVFKIFIYFPWNFKPRERPLLFPFTLYLFKDSAKSITYTDFANSKEQSPCISISSSPLCETVFLPFPHIARFDVSQLLISVLAHFERHSNSSLLNGGGLCHFPPFSFSPPP